METLPIRLLPGQDLGRALEAAVVDRGGIAAFVLSGIGRLLSRRGQGAKCPSRQSSALREQVPMSASHEGEPHLSP